MFIVRNKHQQQPESVPGEPLRSITGPRLYEVSHPHLHPVKNIYLGVWVYMLG